MKLPKYRSITEGHCADRPARPLGKRTIPFQPPADSRRDQSRADGLRTQAFTLVEVAIALAVIGFALVAIIGILPAGLNVQKENREETIINQENSRKIDSTIRYAGININITFL